MLIREEQREDRTQASGESSSGATAQRSRQKQRRSKPNEKIKSQGEDATETEKERLEVLVVSNKEQLYLVDAVCWFCMFLGVFSLTL